MSRFLTIWHRRCGPGNVSAAAPLCCTGPPQTRWSRQSLPWAAGRGWTGSHVHGSRTWSMHLLRSKMGEAGQDQRERKSSILILDIEFRLFKEVKKVKPLLRFWKPRLLFKFRAAFRSKQGLKSTSGDHTCTCMMKKLKLLWPKVYI